jgi:hypothetical protein
MKYFNKLLPLSVNIEQNAKDYKEHILKNFAVSNDKQL